MSIFLLAFYGSQGHRLQEGEDHSLQLVHHGERGLLLGYVHCHGSPVPTKWHLNLHHQLEVGTV